MLDIMNSILTSTSVSLLVGWFIASLPSVIPNISHTPLLIWGNEEHPKTIMGGRRELDPPPITRVRPAEVIRSGIVKCLADGHNFAKLG